MTRRERYIKKYGQKEGLKILSLLATNAANAKWKAFYHTKYQEKLSELENFNPVSIIKP